MYFEGISSNLIMLYWHPGGHYWYYYAGTLSFCQVFETQLSDISSSSELQGQKDKTPGVGVTKPVSSVQLFPNFSASPRYMLAIEYHVHIGQVSLQPSCSDTCQIWMWCKQFNRYFSRIENFAYGEINERSFRNPHPSTVVQGIATRTLCH